MTERVPAQVKFTAVIWGKTWAGSFPSYSLFSSYRFSQKLQQLNALNSHETHSYPSPRGKKTFYCLWAHALNKEKEGEVLPNLDSEKQPTNQPTHECTLQRIEAHGLAQRAAARMQDMDESGSWAFSCLVLLFLVFQQKPSIFILPPRNERRQGGRWITQ